MITDTQKVLIDTRIAQYQKTKASSTRWKLANDTLYNLCNKYPLHTNADEIVAKMWLIGRSYAAAIERRTNADGFSGDFYYDAVAPELLKKGNAIYAICQSF